MRERIQNLEHDHNYRVLINTFDTLEHKSLKLLENIGILSIGPLIPSAFFDGNNIEDKAFGCDLFEKCGSYCQWLDSKAEGLTVYVSFGSLAVVKEEQKEEVLKGLVESERPSLWVVRSSKEDEKKKKNDENYELIGNGMIVPWCSQMEQNIPTFDSLREASMSSQNVSSIEDIFETSLNLEETHYKEGYSEGYKDGLNSGTDEGNQVGLKTGFEVGEELGFYRGCVDVWNAAILVEPTCFSSRVQKNIKQMDELLCKYPFSDPENESATDIIDSLRLKFRTICATLNVRLEYDGYPKASGIDKSGF